MSKHFYFGTTVIFLIVMYLVGVLQVDAFPILLTGFAFAFVMTGMVLNELSEQRASSEKFERSMREKLEKVEFELEVIRDCKFHELTEQGCCLTQTMEAMDKLLDELRNTPKSLIKNQEADKSEA